MTNAYEARYEGAFLDALDLPEGVEVPVVIELIAAPLSEKDSADKPIKSAILSFVGKKKRLILNATNWKNLKAMFGNKPSDWIGQTIKIQRRYLDAKHGFGIDNTLAIRIIPPRGTPILKSAANFMGQSMPYGNVPKPPKKAAPAPKPIEMSTLDLDLAHWLQGVATLQSPETCSEFRAMFAIECPDEIREQVAAALAEKETTLA